MEGGRRSFRLGLPLAIVVGLALAWRLTPLGEWLEPGRLLGWVEAVRSLPAQPVLVPALYGAASLVVFPITVLILCTVLLYGAVKGTAYATAGILVAAAVTYGAGVVAGPDRLERIAGERAQRVVRRLRKSGLVATAVVRLAPVAPFTVVNMVAGAIRMPFPTYLAGTLLGMAPGTVLIAVFGHQALRAFENPGAGTFVALAGCAVLVLVGVLWVRRAARGGDDG